ncbi:GNAT family N-acetyltransferase [Caballeronia sp. SEWSISQ10-4 2]|uniref:GNAT family N-acetyltransferase n=1 Tax=Caballeronia sp. SEWSISQ10-4 2 TaxID=2937438 RepID=UPI002655DFB7|nr:GNAT family N-acetyltransferase [Caballeronia sp. SEWSISQ10-4 2]MDN7179985.1 GNAT family N-acetyltransferase [Caballeronia sp. SEWSISQ10-4 2]
MSAIELLRPTTALLPSYISALEAGWSPDNVRKEVAAREQLHAIEVNAEAFVDGLDDPSASGGPIPLLDGSPVARLPSIVRWIWDGDVCGAIGFRWQAGTAELPPYVLGHIGFSVVPWKRCHGYARQALNLMLGEARRQGLPHVELTVDPENIASQRVIAACNGVLIERFRKTAAYGSAESLRYRIELDD